MTDAEKTVFISYRRDVSSFIARAIFMDLRANGYDVFMDVESIDSGTFDTVILNQIAARAHFLVILTPGSVERCVEADDWLRREIETAMDLRRNVVPLLVNNFSFKGNEQYLKGKLAQLTRYNALNVPHDFFDEAMSRLRSRFLKQPVSVEIMPTPMAEQEVVRQKIEGVFNEPTPKDLRSAGEFFSQVYAEQKGGKAVGATADYYETDTVQYTTQDKILGFLSPRNILRFTVGAPIGVFTFVWILAGWEFNLIPLVVLFLGIVVFIASFAASNIPLPAYVHVDRGINHKRKKDYDGAIAEYTAAIFIHPAFANAYNLRGGARYHKGDFYGAIADYDKAVRLNPKSAIICNNRGEAFFALGQYERALSDFEMSKELDPNNNFALAGLAITYHALGHLDEGKRVWSKLLTKNIKYGSADWVRTELNWAAPLVEEARKLIAKL